MEFHEKANGVHEKIEEMMVNVNKARDELNMARQERESWITDHNKAVKAEMKSGAESDEVADMLVESLLNDGELVFGGVGKDDGVKTKKRTSGSSKKKNMRRMGPIRRR